MILPRLRAAGPVIPAGAALLFLSLAACDVRSSAPAEARLFSAVDTIASPAPPWSAEPNLAVSPDGDVFLTWLERQPDSSYALRLSRHDDGRWAAPTTITRGRDLFVNWADFPSVLALDGDRLAAHWLQRSGEGTYAYDVRVARSDDGGKTWTPGIVPHRDGVQAEHGFVSMWPEDDGRAGLVWLDGRKYGRTDGGAKEMMLMHTILGPDMRTEEETPLDLRICDCCQTSVALASDGPVIAYRDRSEKEVRDIYVVRQVGRVWSEPVRVHADEWEIDACPVNGPSIAAQGRRVAVAWFTGARDTARVFLAFSDDGGETFGAPVRVDDGNPAGRVDAVLLESGAAVVSWVENLEGRAEVRVRRVPEGGERGGAREPAVTVAQSTAARSSGFPRMIAVDDALMFAWTVPGASRNEPSTVRLARGRLAK